jgi:hypothetical protein
LKLPSFGGEKAIGETSTWLTPPHILNALGSFDLDPCSALNRPWDTAKYHYTVEDDGLVQPWFGRVWLNPPYGKEAAPFMEKMAVHGKGIALLFARTETKMFQRLVFPYASSMLFLSGRLKFHRIDGSLASTSQSPSVLIAYGDAENDFLKGCGLDGWFVKL